VATETIIYEGRINNSLCKVYIAPNKTYVGYSSIAILYAKSSIGDFASGDGVLRIYDLEQNLAETEKEGIAWANRWLREKFGCDPNLRRQ